jgi:3-dehydrosphinganine reductase
MRRSVKHRCCGKHALITGGSEGIGLAIARRLVMYGAGVTLVARSMDKLARAHEMLTGEVSGSHVRLLALDVSDESAVNRALRTELSQQPIDYLFNNAGVSRPGEFWNISREDFQRQIDVNFLGALNVTRVALSTLLNSGDPHIVNVASLAGVITVYGQSAYCSSKFALYGLTDVLRAELRPLGIKVTIVLPPETDTAMLDAERPFMPKAAERLQAAAGRLSADQVAVAVLSGMAGSAFEIVPGTLAQLTRLFGRLTPSWVRAYSDWVVRRGMT